MIRNYHECAKTCQLLVNRLPDRESKNYMMDVIKFIKENDPETKETSITVAYHMLNKKTVIMAGRKWSTELKLGRRLNKSDIRKQLVLKGGNLYLETDQHLKDRLQSEWTYK